MMIYLYRCVFVCFPHYVYQQHFCFWFYIYVILTFCSFKQYFSVCIIHHYTWLFIVMYYLISTCVYYYAYITLFSFVCYISLCIYWFMYWKSGTIDRLALLLFIFKCTYYKYFFTLTICFAVLDYSAMTSWHRSLFTSLARSVENPSTTGGRIYPLTNTQNGTVMFIYLWAWWSGCKK